MPDHNSYIIQQYVNMQRRTATQAATMSLKCLGARTKCRRDAAWHAGAHARGWPPTPATTARRLARPLRRSRRPPDSWSGPLCPSGRPQRSRRGSSPWQARGTLVNREMVEEFESFDKAYNITRFLRVLRNEKHRLNQKTHTLAAAPYACACPRRLAHGLVILLLPAQAQRTMHS